MPCHHNPEEALTAYLDGTGPTTGITSYLKNGGTLEMAASASMANHASTCTTQLYDRRQEELSFDEVERILI